MSSGTQRLILWIIGVTVLASALTDRYLVFVKPSMKWFLVAAGIAMILGALFGLVDVKRLLRRGGSDDHHHDHDHDHSLDEAEHTIGHAHGLTRIAWALVVPFTLLGVVTPPPLGAYTAERSTNKPKSFNAQYELPPLPEGDPVPMHLEEYATRAVFDATDSMKGRRIQVIGFVSEIPDEPGWVITRMGMSCCAADAYATKVIPRGDVQRFPKDTWVKATGTWIDTNPDPTASQFPLAEMQVESIVQTDEPVNPYSP